MVSGLNYALNMVKHDRASGLCFGLELACRAGIITPQDDYYLYLWVRSMLRYHAYLESWVIEKVTSRQRKHGEIPFPPRLPSPYELRKPWVEWMIRRINAT